MNLNCTKGPATRPCTSLWSQGVCRSRSFSLSSTIATAPCFDQIRLLLLYGHLSHDVLDHAMLIR